MAGTKEFERILEPGYIGPVKTRNRLIKSAASMFMSHEDDLQLREEVRAYHERLAKGGVGLIIVEAATVDYPKGARFRNRIRNDDDRYIGILSELAEAIHKYDCPAFLQMNHDGPWQIRWGRFRDDPLYPGPPIAASPVYMEDPNDHHNEMPRALTIPEIEEIVGKFADAAVRAHKAGFDGVDINAGSSHLLHNFLSPFWNRRTDIYGGTLENRSRFLVQIIEEIKSRLGKDFPVTVVMNGIEIGRASGIEDGKCFTHEDACGTARLLEEAGADAIQVRSHWIGRHVGGFFPEVLFYPEFPVPMKSVPREYDVSRKGAGATIRLAAGIKRQVTIPVIVVGRLDAQLGEKLLREGHVDFIAMTRRLHADPEFPNKLADGRIDDIAPCTACDFCLGGMGRCRINGLSGTTYRTIERADRKKKVLVIGGGPAGMEAARVSALRGHDVTLYEKSSKLGGLMPLAAIVKGPHPEDVPLIIRYLERQITKLGVKVKLGKEVDFSLINRMRPDAVFLAVGGESVIPLIQGIDGPNVVSGAELHKQLKFFLRFLGPKTLRKLTRFYMPVGKRVVIIGGEVQGCELAEFLTKRGRKVTIVDQAEITGEGLVGIMQEYLFTWFDKKGVNRIGGIKKYVGITGKGLTIINREGKEETLEADTIVPALSLTPNRGMMDKIKEAVPEVFAIGDCSEPSLIVDAIGTGLRTAITL